MRSAAMPPHAPTQRYQQTLPLMGATRPASEKFRTKDSQIVLIALLSVSLSHQIPDAGRVAPISACVCCLRLVVVFVAYAPCLHLFFCLIVLLCKYSFVLLFDCLFKHLHIPIPRAAAPRPRAPVCHNAGRMQAALE